MLGITADQGAGQRDDLATAGGQGAGCVALRGIRALLLVDFVENEVLEESAQVTLDVQCRFVPPYLSGHLPQGRTASYNKLIAVLDLGVMYGAVVGQHPLAPSTSLPKSRTGSAIGRGLAELK